MKLEFQKTCLPNGLRILTENHPAAQGVSIGLWIDTGTRDENIEVAGISHFLEHMVFKRTKKRTAYQIAKELEALGGEINAYTTREYTCFVTYSLPQHFDLCLDVLHDLAHNAVITSSDLEKERKVILQEIGMAEDNLEEYIFDVYFEKAYGESSSMGWPILGSVQSVLRMKREHLIEYYRERYSPDKMVIAAAGQLDHQKIVQEVEALFSKSRRATSAEKSAKAKKKSTSAQSSAAGFNANARRRPPRLRTVCDVVEKASEQVHMLFGFPASSYRHPRHFEGTLLSSLLGGGMTSRLYQSVRERNGLVYSIYTQLTTFTDCGVHKIYASTEPKHVRRVTQLILQDLEKLRQKGVTRRELEFFKRQLTGQILLGSDDVENRMNSIAVNEMVLDRYRPVSEAIKDIQKIDLDTFNIYLKKYLDPEQLSMLMLGACKKEEDLRWMQTLI